LRPVVQLTRALGSHRRSAGALAVLLTAPIIANSLRALSLGWFPTFDLGFLQLRALDVGSRATPLVGMPSTLSAATGITTFHPGPLQSWLQAIPMRVFSFTPSVLLISQVLLNIAWVVLAVWMLGRSPWARYRTVTLVAGLLFLASVGPEIAHDPWNPHAAVIPMAVALLATAVVIAGDARAAWVAVFAGSFAAQCHLSFAAVGAVTVCASVGTVAVRSRRDDATARRHLLLSAAVFVVSWLGPIVDQLFRHGNIGHLLTGGGTGVTLGWHESWSRFVKIVLPWRLLFDQHITTAELVASVGVWESLLASLLVVSTVATMRRRGGAASRVGVLLAVVVLAQIAITAVMPVTMGTIFGLHLARAWWPVVFMVWVCAVFALSAWLAERVQWRRAFSVAVVAVSGVAALATAVLYGARDVRDGTWYEPTRDVAEAIARLTPSGSYDLAVPGWTFESPLPVGVVADLVLRGYDVRVDALMSPGLLHDSHRASADVSDRRITLDIHKAGQESDVPEGELIFADTYRVWEWNDTDYEVFVYLS